jgi:cytochrome oxidase Cu insertion factor (SCO1/SenC/PrrC family)
MLIRYSMGILTLLAALAPAQTVLTPSDLSRVAVGAKAPDFELPAANGRKVSLASLRGKNIILVFYRGYW